jgi:low affinity Fe/Cu permease
MKAAQKQNGKGQFFRRCSQGVSIAVGSPWAFLLAVAIVAAWAISGPLFGYSDTWQLVINTGTTIVTFLMVFLIQHTQNRDSLATQLKLDELLRAVHNARTGLVDLEEQSDEELARIHKEFQVIRDHEEQSRVENSKHQRT